MVKSICYVIFIFIFGGMQASAQFKGGIGNGSNLAILVSTNNIQSGGGADGYMQALLDFGSSIQHGSIGDGYVAASVNFDFGIQHGSIGDGYSLFSNENMNSIQRGNGSDGYSLSQHFQSYIWTGALSSNWNLKDNWNKTVIPRPRHTVIIPADTKNNLVLEEAGNLIVGKNLSNETYVAKEIFVASNAVVVVGKDVLISNYGLINIRGEVYIYNISDYALQNKTNGLLRIQSGFLLFSDGN